MGQLINLKQVKKRIARDVAVKAADTNRALFGRTKAEKKRDDLHADQARSAVDRHRIDAETSK